jgi:tetratricopeptide (TPR) repeat protein
VRILHLDLKLIADASVELRYFFDNPNRYERRSLSLQDISDLIEVAERDYYVRLPVDHAITGQKLFHWLDGSDRWLVQQLNQYPGEEIVLAISASGGLAHLPWEVLHDGSRFLVERSPTIVPVRWVKSDAVNSLAVVAEPENRALQVLFMATSPLDVEPVLDFEAEEGRILAATARQPLSLIVEESGCLSELGYLVSVYSKGHFDVLHLTGHAKFSNDKPRFITETETGEAYSASAADIAKELQFQFPNLIFLSGCRTGQAGQSGAVPSIAEELLKSGAKAVLGWGQAVLDTEATAAAATLYQAVSAGKPIAEAVALTYQALIQHKARDWHLLRLYVANTLPGELVTPMRGTRGRKPAPPSSVVPRFLDPVTQTVKVPKRENFVGRRRQLQNSLRALTQPTDQIGVLIYGMGGLGKSSLAARLCDRLSDFELVIWIGRIDVPSLVRGLSEKLDSLELRETLQNPNEELKFRLRRVFRQLAEEAAKPFLLVLDDFEINLEARGESYVLKPEATSVLEALVWSIRELYAPHRLILTSRYDFEFTQLQHFYKQSLDAFRGADLRKKCDRLDGFNSRSQVDKTLQARALKLTDGNPRLLEYLSNEVLQSSSIDPATILDHLETNPINIRKQILVDSLLNRINQPMQEVLQRALIFELPVPREAIIAICETVFNAEESINRVISLGLLEVSPDRSLRVPRILPLQPPENLEALCKKGAEVLYHVYLEDEKTTEEKLLEVHRLSLLGKAEKTAVTIVKFLTERWFHRARFHEAFWLCHNTLAVTKDYDVLNRLAFAEVQLGGIYRARERYQQALKNCHEEKSKSAIYCNQADLEVKFGNSNEAFSLYQQALEIDERNDDKGAMATTLAMIGMIKADLALEGMLMVESAPMTMLVAYIREASWLSDRAQGLVESIENLERKVATIFLIGQLECKCKRFDNAITLFKQAEEISKEINNPYSQAMALQWLGGLEADIRRNFDIALDYLNQALDILFSQVSREFEAPGEVERVRQIIANVQWKRSLFKDVKDEASTIAKINQLFHQIEESGISKSESQNFE